MMTLEAARQSWVGPETRAMLEIAARHKGPACRPVGEWLVAVAKRTWPRWSGWQWFIRTNAELTWNVVCYHHPAQLCWEWFLSLAIGPRNAKHFKWRKLFSSYRGQWTLTVPYLLRLSWHTQNYGWMLSGDATARLNAIAYSDAELLEAGEFNALVFAKVIP